MKVCDGKGKVGLAGCKMVTMAGRGTYPELPGATAAKRVAVEGREISQGPKSWEKRRRRGEEMNWRGAEEKNWRGEECSSTGGHPETRRG